MYARVTDEFAFNAIVAGVFIQVPGSWGIRGLLSFAYGVCNTVHIRVHKYLLI